MRSSLRGLLTALVLGVLCSPASAQLQLAVVSGTVLDESGGVMAGSTIELTDPLGATISTTVADSGGKFVFNGVSPGRYQVRASITGFEPIVHPIDVTSALPVELTLRIALRTSISEVIVEEGMEPDNPSTRASIAGESIALLPVRAMTKGLQEAVATLPGWATEDNGLLHVRGTDDGFLYVIDGVPVYERLDQLSGLGPDLGTLESIQVITGYIPAEFGYKAGGVIDVRSKSANKDWSGLAQVGRGSSDDTQGAASLGGPLNDRLSLTVGAAAQSSRRFLDPIHPDNFHNEGDVAGGSAQLRWVRPDADIISLSAGGGRSSYDVPNTAEQHEAGQDQRQRVAQAQVALSWQHAWSRSTYSQVSAYLRDSSVDLAGSPHDTPLLANAGRSLQRAGFVAGLSRHIGGNTIKAGVEAQRLVLDEDFTFFVSDIEAAEEAGFSEAALQFDASRPFAFAGQSTQPLWSAFLQDDWTATGALTISAGLRFDQSRLLLTRRQFSPRLGAAYRIEGTVIRGSVSRFFQPPQPENLLLSSSAEARELSAFTDEGAEGGADLEPERQWAFEAGINQPLGSRFRLDAAIWRRSISEAADPNVFAGTTIIFPNAVARGRAAGFDVRVEVPRRRSWSGYINLAIGAVRQNGPITGGVFLEDDVADVASGEEFIPDHDQLVVAGGGVTWMHARSGASVSATIRYESGTPLGVSDEDEDDLRERPGSEMVDFDRGRVAPRTIASILAEVPFWKNGRRSASIRASVLNLFDDRYAYNFGNPFSGTHFGAPRTVSLSARVGF